MFRLNWAIYTSEFIIISNESYNYAHLYYILFHVSSNGLTTIIWNESLLVSLLNFHSGWVVFFCLVFVFTILNYFRYNMNCKNLLGNKVRRSLCFKRKYLKTKQVMPTAFFEEQNMRKYQNKRTHIILKETKSLTNTIELQIYFHVQNWLYCGYFYGGWGNHSQNCYKSVSVHILTISPLSFFIWIHYLWKTSLYSQGLNKKKDWLTWYMYNSWFCINPVTWKEFLPLIYL